MADHVTILAGSIDCIGDLKMPRQAIEQRNEDDWPVQYHVVVLRPDQIDLIAEAVARKMSDVPAPPKEVKR